MSVRLDGAATLHAAANSIADLSFTFEDGAFASTGASHVDSRVKNNLRVTFGDEVGFFNVIPYGEPYEDYLSGFWLAGTNGWTADYYADAGVVGDDADVTANLKRYLRTHEALPIATNHIRTLTVQDSLRVAIHSETNRLVYVDFMTQPVALQEVPPSDTNVQYAFYVSTNAQLVIWHCNRTGAAPTNDMVQTNGTMNHFIVSGRGRSYVDDLTVRTALPGTFGGSLGSVFKFR